MRRSINYISQNIMKNELQGECASRVVTSNSVPLTTVRVTELQP